MYADDLAVHTHGKTVIELNEKLNHDMVNIKCWCMDINMSVNQDTSKAMIITTYQKATRLDTDEDNVTYDGSKLLNVDSENLLSIKIDKNLSWKNLVDKVAMKMKNVLFDHKYMYVHNILYFRKCKYKSVWRLLLRQNSLPLS